MPARPVYRTIDYARTHTNHLSRRLAEIANATTPDHDPECIDGSWY